MSELKKKRRGRRYLKNGKPCDDFKPCATLLLRKPLFALHHSHNIFFASVPDLSKLHVTSTLTSVNSRIIMPQEPPKAKGGATSLMGICFASSHLRCYRRNSVLLVRHITIDFIHDIYLFFSQVNATMVSLRTLSSDHNNELNERFDTWNNSNAAFSRTQAYIVFKTFTTPHCLRTGGRIAGIVVESGKRCIITVRF